MIKQKAENDSRQLYSCIVEMFLSLLQSTYVLQNLKDVELNLDEDVHQSILKFKQQATYCFLVLLTS